MSPYVNWVHAIFTTHGSWLPGDPRGFRSRAHRIHSSGDVRCPPPAGEHEGLYRAVVAMNVHAVEIPEHLRLCVANALVGKCELQGANVRIAAVARRHVHMLLRVGSADAKVIVGRAKQYASHAIRREMPGKIWADGCNVVRIDSESNYRSVVDYITCHQAEEKAALWVHPRYRGQEQSPDDVTLR